MGEVKVSQVFAFLLADIWEQILGFKPLPFLDHLEYRLTVLGVNSVTSRAERDSTKEPAAGAGSSLGGDLVGGSW